MCLGQGRVEFLGLECVLNGNVGCKSVWCVMCVQSMGVVRVCVCMVHEYF